MNMNKYALIVAGGYGSRMNITFPKQFLKLGDIPILMHTLKVFFSYDNNIKLILVLPEDQISYWKNLCHKYDFYIEHTIATGGNTRFHSVKNGLEKINDSGIVFIHDGVRPLVSRETIKNCYNTAIVRGNALPVIKPSESIREVLGDTNKAVDRNHFYLVQTPQTFDVTLIKNAYNFDYDASFTDDASVLESTGVKINLVNGNRENIKITYPEDIAIAEALLKKSV